MKGLLVHVYRGQHDCTNEGISSKHNDFILIGHGHGVPEIFDPTDETPALILVERTIGGEKYLHAQPLENLRKGNVGWMFGGHFVWTSDSRFPNKYPLPIHDRQETRSQHEALTK